VVLFVRVRALGRRCRSLRREQHYDSGCGTCYWCTAGVTRNRAYDTVWLTRVLTGPRQRRNS
jgi:hypothetical protein